MREKRVAYRTGEDPGEANTERGAKVWRNNILLVHRCEGRNGFKSQRKFFTYIYIYTLRLI